MATVDDLAAKLAVDTMKVMDATGDERFYVEVGTLLAAASQSLEEAFLTEMRVRLAERAARSLINKKIHEIKSAAAAQSKAAT